jgi:hypothetical protein
MSTAPGWYPDPGNQPGMYRYWDGAAWTEALSQTPAAPPPAEYMFAADLSQSSAKQNAGPIIVIIVIAVVLALIIYFAVSLFRNDSTVVNDDPAANSTEEVCPKEPESIPPHADHPADGRIHGGDISYPELPEPWGYPSQTEIRVPFGRDVTSQSITTESNYEFGQSWVASVVIGELIAGDGFYTPEEGSKIVTKCILSTFYGDNSVTREDVRTEAYQLDGKDGWIVETNLSFSIPNLQATGEWVVIIIIQTSLESSSIFYSSVPNNASPYNDSVNPAIANLQVDS